MIVVGQRDRDQLAAFLLGNVSQKLVSLAAGDPPIRSPPMLYSTLLPSASFRVLFKILVATHCTQSFRYKIKPVPLSGSRTGGAEAGCSN